MDLEVAGLTDAGTGERNRRRITVNRHANGTRDRRRIVTSVWCGDARCGCPALSRRRRAGRQQRGGVYWSGSGAVLEPPALVAGLDDVAVVRQAVEQGRGHLGVAEHARPFAKGQVGGDQY